MVEATDLYRLSAKDEVINCPLHLSTQDVMEALFQFNQLEESSGRVHVHKSQFWQDLTQ